MNVISAVITILFKLVTDSLLTQLFLFLVASYEIWKTFE